MNIVDRPMLPPGYCIATMAGEDPKGFIDTGLTPPCVDPRVYVSVCWIEQMGRELGMVDSKLLDEANARIKDLELQLRESDALLEASEHILTHMQSKPKKKRAAV